MDWSSWASYSGKEEMLPDSDFADDSKSASTMLFSSNTTTGDDIVYSESNFLEITSFASEVYQEVETENGTAIVPTNEGSVQSDVGIPAEVKVVMCIAYIVITITAIGGNAIVCYIVLAYQRMRTVTNFFIVNLAIGDILMAMLCIPFSFVSNLLLMYWPFGAVMCPVVCYAQAVSVFISAYTLIAISIDRYVAIMYPLKPRMTKLQAKVVILIVWFVALVTPIPVATNSQLTLPYPVNRSSSTPERLVCTEVWDPPEYRYYYGMSLMILQYFFPVSVLIFTYARIGCVVWGKRAPGEAEDTRDQRLAASKRKMVRMMITVVAIYTMCWLPFNVLVVLGDIDDSIWAIPNMVYIYTTFHWLSMSHGCYNPLVYCWMNSRFRDGFYHVFSRWLPCIFSSTYYKRRDRRHGYGRKPYHQVKRRYPQQRGKITHQTSNEVSNGHHLPHQQQILAKRLVRVHGRLPDAKRWFHLGRPFKGFRRVCRQTSLDYGDSCSSRRSTLTSCTSCQSTNNARNRRALTFQRSDSSQRTTSTMDRYTTPAHSLDFGDAYPLTEGKPAALPYRSNGQTIVQDPTNAETIDSALPGRHPLRKQYSIQRSDSQVDEDMGGPTPV